MTNLIIKRAETEDTQEVFCLIQNTIKSEYKKVYTKNEVEFFSELHSKNAIAEDIVKRKVYILIDDDKIMATATLEKNHILRVFVEKSCIGQGYGSRIMDFIENKVSENYSESILDTSLVAKKFYINRGYFCVGRDSVKIKNNEILEYDIMKKLLTEGKV